MIQSYECIFESLTPKMLHSFVKQLVRVNDQSYVLVINTTDDEESHYKI